MGAINYRQVCLAREFRGRSQVWLARAIDIPQGTMSKIESGILEPSSDLVNRIAKVLFFPKEFFYQQVEYMGLPYTFFRRRLSLTQQFLKAVAARINIVRLHIGSLLDAFHLDEPALGIIDVSRYGNRIEALAAEYRLMLGVQSGPVDNVTEIVERAGAIVIPSDFETDEIDGVSINDFKLPPLIFVNKDLPGDRWRWTVAHEFAHVVLHSRLNNFNQNDDTEDEAHRFAAEFLMPKKDIRGNFATGLTLRKAAGLKSHWKVSMQALIMRAAELEYLSPSQKRRLFTQLSTLGYRKKEPNIVSLEQPRVLQALFDYYFNRLSFSFDDVLFLTTISGQDFYRLYPGVVKPKPQLRLFENEQRAAT